MKKNRFEWFLLTGFFSGLFPKAPGTAGSIAAALLAWAVVTYSATPYITLWLLAIFFSIAGIKLTDRYEAAGGEHDDKRIVIDEFAGMFITVGLLGDIKHDTLIKIILAFIAFRILDITKPSIIGKVDKNVKGGLGVMGDDILAGLFAAILAGLFYILYLKIQ